MLTLDEIQKKLKTRNIQRIAELMEVHPNTVYRIQRGESQPNYKTLIKLSEVLEND